MRIIKVDAENPNTQVIHEAIDVLSSGGVILYPTDTVYGLGANIFNETAVERIYNIKKRDSLKPLSVCVSSMERLSLLAEVRPEHKKLIIDNLPGPFTFIFYKKNIVPDYLTTNNKIGIRIPDSKISMELSQNFPITSTSANLSLKRTLSTPEEIIKQLGSDINLAIDVGPLNSTAPSTVVDLTDKKLNILRYGVGKLL